MHGTHNHLSLCSIWRQLLEEHSDELFRAALNILLTCFLSDLCYPLGEGSHLHPSPGLPFSYFELSVTWIRLELYVEVVGVLARVKVHTYNQDLNVKVDGPEEGSGENTGGGPLLTFSPGVQNTRSSYGISITGEQYACWYLKNARI